MDEKMLRSIELAKQMPDMTYAEWKLLSQFINCRFERSVERKRKEAEQETRLLETLDQEAD